MPGSRVLGSLYPASCIIPSNRNKGTLMTPCSTEATGLDIVVLHNLSVGWMIRRRGITRTTQTNDRLGVPSTGVRIEGVSFPAFCRAFPSGRCWVRTSDLCRVKSRYCYLGGSPLFRNARKSADSSLAHVVGVRRCSRGLVYYWCKGTNLEILNIRRPHSLGFAPTLAAAKPRSRSREFDEALRAGIVCVSRNHYPRWSSPPA